MAGNFGIKAAAAGLSAILAFGLCAPDSSHAQGGSKRHRKARVTETAADPSEAERGASAASASTASAPSSASSSATASGASGAETSASPAASGGGAAASPGAPVPAGDKVGRFMANFKIGPSFGAYNAGHQGAIVLELGWSVLPNKNAYLLFPLQFQFASGGGAVILPVGFQYDIAIAKVPGLYLYPRLSLAYAAFIASAFGSTSTTHFGALIPEFGAKYVLKGRWNFGGEIFSLPIFFNSGGAAIQYRILLSAGMNF